MNFKALFILLLIFSSCITTKHTQSDHERKIKAITYTRYNEQNNVLVEAQKESYHYDSIGNLVLSTKYRLNKKPETIKERFKYEYDSSGKLVKEFRAFKNQDFINPYKYYYYNINGQLMSIKELSSYDVKFITILDYDELYRLRDSLVIASNSGGGFHRYHFEYKGKFTKPYAIKGHSSKGKGGITITTLFDYKRRRIRSKQIRRKHENDLLIEYTWKNGCLESILSNKSNQRNFYYNDEGQMVGEEYKKNDRSVSHIFIDYDSAGNWTNKYYIKKRRASYTELVKSEKEPDFKVVNTNSMQLADTFRIEKRTIKYFQ